MISTTGAIDRFLKARRHWQIICSGTILTAALGTLDHSSGFEMSFSVFYLFPILFVTWYGSRWSGLAMCLLSALMWLFVDYTAGHTYTQIWMPYWNAAVRLSLFAIVTYLTATIKIRLDAEHLAARLDHLTGLKNSLAFHEDAEFLFENARRYRYPIAVGFIDIDGFKALNDNLGHTEGNRALKAVADAVSQSARASDIVARLGGDEFVAVLSHTGLSAAKTFFDRLQRLLVTTVNEAGWSVGFSIGVAVFAESVPSVSDALKHADTLMYKVKESGGNQVGYEQYAGVTPSTSELAPTDISEPLGSTRLRS
jgi:diguanylate cyclase (GGDEF)-like protein